MRAIDPETPCLLASCPDCGGVLGVSDILGGDPALTGLIVREVFRRLGGTDCLTVFLYEACKNLDKCSCQYEEAPRGDSSATPEGGDS